MPSKIKQGIVFALLAALISGVSIFYNKLVVVKGIDATIFNILKNGGTALIVSMLLLSSTSRGEVAKLTKSKWMLLLVIAVVGGSIPFVLFFDGLKAVPAINANLIQKTLFVWVAILAVVFLREKLTRVQVLGYGLVLISNLFIGGFTSFALNTAEIMVFVATLFWSVENIIAKIALRDIDPKIVVWGRMFLGVMLLLGYALVTGKIGLFSHISLLQLLPIIGSMLLLTGYVLSWYKALSLAPVSAVTAILVLATPITNVLSAVFITHSLDVIQFLNFTFSLLGISFIVFFTSKAHQYEQPRTGFLQ